MRRGLSTQEALALLEQLDSDISGDDSNDEDFRLDNVNLQNSSSSESSDSDAVEHSTNVISPVIPKSGRSRGRRRSQGRRNNVPNLSDGCSNDKYSSSSGIIWTPMNRNCPTSTAGRTPARNIVSIPSGPTPFARRNIGTNPASAWRLMVNEAMVKHIQTCTVAEARRQLGDDSNWYVTLVELDAFFALLYARGALGHSKLCADELWNKNWGPPVFRETMSRNRFREIMRYLRFDVRSSRAERLATNKFALASETWYKLIENCYLCYNPGAEITVDEQLLPCKSRCRFIQYMANKPDKFGIKFWLATDVESKYILNGHPYLGKDEERPADVQLGESVVLKLLQPHLNKGLNVTTDNFFTSVKLADELSAKKTTIVGTMRLNKRELPPIARDTSSPRYSSSALKYGNKTLTIYRCKKRKNVAILSTMHTDVFTDNSAKMKPNTVTYYNRTKCGVDVADQMLRKYSTNCGTRRWPVHVFYNVLDIAALNAWIIFKQSSDTSISRREFILSLVEELRVDALRNSCPPIDRVPILKRKKCAFKRCKGQNKTSASCEGCQKPICGKCIAVTVKRAYCCTCANV